ncbi:macrophage migration inhibitory factor-like [Rhopalosiphum maidis]|uniref:macrophage migration inhibitory factor-like n=1 Tax=Rhopalosiphum maidis TaxID=43146 RepID=UPI000EFDE7B1|nr:macrophage migration inhibitory factor-like [Rhopalosiphum maidis]
MPTISITTNIPKYKIPSTFLAETSKLISQTLQTPELYIGVRIKAGQQMCWFNDELPCALGNITGTGNFGVDENKHYASIIYDFLEKKIGIPQDRFYLSFVEQKPCNIGVKGTTLEEIIQ